MTIFFITVNPFDPIVAFSQLSSKICCPRDCVSRHNGGTSGAPLKPLRDDSALRALSSLRSLRGGTRGTPIMPRDAVSRTAINVERNGGHKWVNTYMFMTCTYNPTCTSGTLLCLFASRSCTINLVNNFPSLSDVGLLSIKLHSRSFIVIYTAL